jgi:hypothetical protein
MNQTTKKKLIVILIKKIGKIILIELKNRLKNFMMNTQNLKKKMKKEKLKLKLL